MCFINHAHILRRSTCLCLVEIHSFFLHKKIDIIALPNAQLVNNEKVNVQFDSSNCPTIFVPITAPARPHIIETQTDIARKCVGKISTAVAFVTAVVNAGNIKNPEKNIIIANGTVMNCMIIPHRPDSANNVMSKCTRPTNFIIVPRIKKAKMYAIPIPMLSK